jgi:hypothetical protein
MNNIQFIGDAIYFDSTLAQILGQNAAQVLNKIMYWVEHNKDKGNKDNFKKGMYWTYNTMKTWHEKYFKHLSLSTVRRAFKKLRDLGILIAGCFNLHISNRTKWYTVDYGALETLISGICPSGTFTFVQDGKCDLSISGKSNTYNKQENKKIDMIGSEPVSGAETPFKENFKKGTKKTGPSDVKHNAGPVISVSTADGLSLDETAENFKGKINYDALIIEKNHDKNLIDEIVQVYADMMTSHFRGGMVNMGGGLSVPEAEAKKVYENLGQADVELFLESFGKLTEPVIKTNNYIRKSLYCNHEQVKKQNESAVSAGIQNKPRNKANFQQRQYEPSEIEKIIKKLENKYVEQYIQDTPENISDEEFRA